jgi:hypothetical protein
VKDPYIVDEGWSECVKWREEQWMQKETDEETLPGGTWRWEKKVRAQGSSGENGTYGEGTVKGRCVIYADEQSQDQPWKTLTVTTDADEIDRDIESGIKG